MSDNLQPQGNFGIQDTMNVGGAGDTQLLNDLMAPETAQADPEAVEPIIKEVEDTIPEKTITKGKEIIPPKSVDGKTEEEKQTGESLIADFLSDDPDAETEEEDVTEDKPAEPETKDVLDEVVDEEETETSAPNFEALANDLFNLGVFNKEGDEEVTIASPEDFLARFESEKKKGAQSLVQDFIGQFGEDYQQAFESIFVKGVNPKEYFGAYNNIVNFSEMDLTKENNQKQVMKQALKEQGFEAEDIDKEVERLKSYGDLESVSTRHHKVLVKKEAKKLQQLEAQSQQELQAKNAIKQQYQTNVQTILSDKVKDKEFDGIPINSNLANELQDFLLVDKWKTPSGETLTDFDRSILDLKRPENHELKVKVGLLLKMLEKDPSLSTIQRAGVTKKSNQLFGEVARQVTKAKTTVASKRTNSNTKKPNSWFL
tara:strand:- start:328 stop:1614 length:1287 start_codon:yes stop_codon:yes gene_type:complete